MWIIKNTYKIININTLNTLVFWLVIVIYGNTLITNFLTVLTLEYTQDISPWIWVLIKHRLLSIFTKLILFILFFKYCLIFSLNLFKVGKEGGSKSILSTFYRSKYFWRIGTFFISSWTPMINWFTPLFTAVDHNICSIFCTCNLYSYFSVLLMYIFLWIK